MKAELVMIGSELLLGQHVDTNSAFLARELNAVGVSVLYISVVGDNRARMREVLERALNRSDIVITSGGLGPTEDDLTRVVVAAVAGVELEFRQDLYDHIAGLFAGIGRPMTENNARQAYVPAGAEAIANPQGTAPAFLVTGKGGHRMFCLPGVPRELEWLVKHEVLPRIQAAGAGGTIKSRTLHLCGLGESRVDSQVADLLRDAQNPTLGILAHQFVTDLRITARADSEPEADALIGDMEGELRRRFGKQIYGVDDETLEGAVADLLTQYDATVAVAEMVTGGAVARRLVTANQPCFLGGVVLPHESAVGKFLGPAAPAGDLAALAAALARRVSAAYGATVGLAVAGTPEHGGGDTVFGGGHTAVALAMPDDEPQTWAFPFGGLSPARQDRVAVLALELVRRTLIGCPTP